MQRAKKILVGLLTAVWLFSSAAVVWADTQPTSFGSDMADQLQAAAGEKGANLGEPTDPRTTVIFLIRAFLSIVGLILLGLFVYAGYLWTTAGGNSEQIDQAKGYIRNGVIGLIIVLSAYSITIFAANLARGVIVTTPGFSFVK